MTPATRLKLCLFLVFVSAVYAIIVIEEPHVATSLSAFYVTLIVTIFIITNIWKKSS